MNTIYFHTFICPITRYLKVINNIGKHIAAGVLPRGGLS